MQGPYFLFFTCLMVLPFFLSDVSTASLLAATPNVVGGYQPIKDVDDPRIIGIAEFAVEEYNKKGATRTLEFINVVKGEFQIVAGTNYRLLIVAEGSTHHANKYLTIVFEDIKGNKKLVSFLPAPDETLKLKK